MDQAVAETRGGTLEESTATVNAQYQFLRLLGSDTERLVHVGKVPGAN